MRDPQFDWTEPRTPEASWAAPKGKPESPESTVFVVVEVLRLWVQMRGSYDSGVASDGSRLELYQPLPSECPCLCCVRAFIRRTSVLFIGSLPVSVLLCDEG